jgi:hypothetical protein
MTENATIEPTADIIAMMNYVQINDQDETNQQQRGTTSVITFWSGESGCLQAYVAIGWECVCGAHQ